MKQKVWQSLAIIFIATTFIACGGGGNGSNPTTPSDDNSPDTNTSDTNTSISYIVKKTGQTKSYDTSGDTATTYCEDLSLAGSTDWKPPTVEELEGIVNYGSSNPAIDIPSFTNTSSNRYWSSSTSEGYKDDAWFVNFNFGYVYGDGKDFFTIMLGVLETDSEL